MIQPEPHHHLQDLCWLQTPAGDPRGYIQPDRLTELWFHTGTTCNLRCPFCLEGSKPGDNRINPIQFEDAKPFIDEALTMGVEKFSFTGGEPFVIPEFVQILEYALEYRPCMILTNGTEPVLNRLDEILPLRAKPHALKFRVSIDYPDAKRHDAGRGPGNFQRAFQCLGRLYEFGFDVSIARQRDSDENIPEVDALFLPHLESVGVPAGINIVSFPDFLTPGTLGTSPEITEDCMVRYHNEKSRGDFMCSFSKMVLKKDGRMRVYACTLVDDDPDYDLGGSLTESMRTRVMLRHHRCYSCFAFGASCSEG